VAEEAVHVRGRGVAWGAGVDDGDGAPGPPELERCGQTGGSAADDDDVEDLLLFHVGDAKEHVRIGHAVMPKWQHRRNLGVDWRR
jgi:hypothetical protein